MVCGLKFFEYYTDGMKPQLTIKPRVVARLVIRPKVCSLRSSALSKGWYPHPIPLPWAGVGSLR